jgi:cytochrome c-type biogenesis protein
MSTDNVNVLTAFAFGLLSFISPCVLPIVPGYISFISGVSIDAMKNDAEKKTVRNQILLRTLMFILGFSIVFISLGASATVVGKFLLKELNIISKIAGVVIVVFGLNMVGVFKIGFLNYEKRFHTEAKPLSIFGALLVGLAFAFGWTPCIGPILAAILAIASQQETVGQGIVLLTSYSLGLGIPFLITGMSITVFYNFFNKLKKYMHTVEIIGGVLLIIVGVLIFTNSLTILSGYLSKWFPFLNEIG